MEPKALAYSLDFLLPQAMWALKCLGVLAIYILSVKYLLLLSMRHERRSREDAIDSCPVTCA